MLYEKAADLYLPETIKTTDLDFLLQQILGCTPQVFLVVSGSRFQGPPLVVISSDS